MIFFLLQYAQMHFKNLSKLFLFIKIVTQLSSSASSSPFSQNRHIKPVVLVTISARVKVTFEHEMQTNLQA